MRASLTGTMTAQTPVALRPRLWAAEQNWQPGQSPSASLAVSWLYYQPMLVIGDDYQRHVENRRTGKFPVRGPPALFWLTCIDRHLLRYFGRPANLPTESSET